MCYWKQWRYPRTKVRHLRALGVSLDMAIKHAISRKKYWRMSRTPAIRFAMTNKWLSQQGLSFIEATLVRPSSSSRNRLVRTRMLGGVGGRSEMAVLTRFRKGRPMVLGIINIKAT